MLGVEAVGRGEVLLVLGVAWAASQGLLLVQLDHRTVLLDVHALVGGPIARISRRVTLLRIVLATHEHLALAHNAGDFARGVKLLRRSGDHVDATSLACRRIELV